MFYPLFLKESLNKCLPRVLFDPFPKMDRTLGPHGVYLFFFFFGWAHHPWFFGFDKSFPESFGWHSGLLLDTLNRVICSRLVFSDLFFLSFPYSSTNTGFVGLRWFCLFL